MKARHLFPHSPLHPNSQCFLIALLLGAVFGLFFFQTAFAATRTVTNVNNSGVGSLRDVINKALPGDTIVFDPSLNGKMIVLTTGALNITKRLTIKGPGPDNLTISGNKKFRIFYIYPYISVDISGLTIANGYIKNQRGAGIFNAGRLTVDSSIITDCIIDGVSFGGGGIYNKGSLTVTSSTIRNNSDKTYSVGGAGIYNDGNLTLQNSLVTNNQSHNKPVIGCYGGGGICNRGTAVIMDSTISENRASTFSYGGGAGIYNDKQLTVSRCVVRDNTAIQTFGSGIMNWGEGTTFIEYTTFSGNITDNGGGAIENLGTMTVTNSTIAYNKATSTQYGGGGIDNMDGTLTLINSTVSNNSSAYGGGGLWNEDGQVDAIHTTFSDNTAPTGGGIFNTGQTAEATINLVNTIVANSLEGGDCLNDTGAVNITDTLIEDNSCGPTLSGDPNLGLLQDNGGMTYTHALLPGSIAIDTASLCISEIESDQRDVLRPFGIACDLGAFEFRDPEDVPEATSPTTP